MVNNEDARSQRRCHSGKSKFEIAKFFRSLLGCWLASLSQRTYQKTIHYHIAAEYSSNSFITYCWTVCVQAAVWNCVSQSIYVMPLYTFSGFMLPFSLFHISLCERGGFCAWSLNLVLLRGECEFGLALGLWPSNYVGSIPTRPTDYSRFLFFYGWLLFVSNDSSFWFVSQVSWLVWCSRGFISRALLSRWLFFRLLEFFICFTY